jgi:GT2 family glycosyltransferase
MSGPLVSVVIPTFNHEDYVAAAVASVLAQTHSKLEIIVIDDASRDRTWKVLQGFDDARLHRSRHEENRGAHATLNEGLAAAHGDFIAILNSDDIYANDRIEAGLAQLQAEGADLVGSDIVLIDDAGAEMASHWWVEAFSALKAVWQGTHDWPATLLEGNVFMTSSNFLFSRAYYETIGGFGDYRYVLDYDWLLRGLRAGRRLAWLDRPLLRYRWHETNTISERPLAANVECAAMLRAHLPALLGDGPQQATRLEHLASQWARLDCYVGEIGATLRHEAVSAVETALNQLIADRDGWIADRDAWIAERDQLIQTQKGWLADRDRWIGERDEIIRLTSATLEQCQRDNQQLVDSRSYRIGRMVTAPARWLGRHLAAARGRR